MTPQQFDLQKQVSEWTLKVVIKHLPLDDEDRKQLHRIITDARFYETVLYLQEEEEDDDYTPG